VESERSEKSERQNGGLKIVGMDCSMLGKADLSDALKVSRDRITNVLGPTHARARKCQNT
jgi:hypothetical protein